MYRRLYSDDGTCEFVETDVLSDMTGLECLDKSLALQSGKDEADINTIVKRFGLTGQVPAGFRVPTYADFLNAPDDYRGALEAVRSAESAFLKVPAAIRARFENDPHLFVAFCSDPANLAELRKMGLAPSPAPETPPTGEVQPPYGV